MQRLSLYNIICVHYTRRRVHYYVFIYSVSRTQDAGTSIVARWARALQTATVYVVVARSYYMVPVRDANSDDNVRECFSPGSHRVLRGAS